MAPSIWNSTVKSQAATVATRVVFSGASAPTSNMIHDAIGHNEPNTQPSIRGGIDAGIHRLLLANMVAPPTCRLASVVFH
eukprot:1624231-Rhodomonas_salina.1